MIQEVRTIKFQKEDLEKALQAYRRTKNDLFPAGKIIGWQQGENRALSVGIETSHGASMRHVHVAVPTRDVTEALVKFCIEHKIKLPRRANKEVIYADGHAMLLMELDLEVG